MVKFNKEFIHKGYKFNIAITLNIRSEQVLEDSKIWHKIITNSMYSFDYYHEEEVEGLKLAQKIEEHCQLASKYIDKLTGNRISREEHFLLDLGFTRQV